MLRPLVGLVDDDRVVLVEQSRSRWISASRMPSVMTLTRVSVADLVGEAHLVADRVPSVDLELLGDALGDRAGRDPPRLRVADQAARRRGPARGRSWAAGWSCPSPVSPATMTTWWSRIAPPLASLAGRARGWPGGRGAGGGPGGGGRRPRRWGGGGRRPPLASAAGGCRCPPPARAAAAPRPAPPGLPRLRGGARGAPGLTPPPRGGCCSEGWGVDMAISIRRRCRRPCRPAQSAGGWPVVLKRYAAGPLSAGGSSRRVVLLVDRRPERAT